MELFSFKFLAILFLATAFITIRARSKRKGPAIIRGKQISIVGQTLTAVISNTAALACLLDDGKSFGEDYKEKEPPKLPHSDDCQCELVNVNYRSEDWFNVKSKDTTFRQTDLGELEKKDFRFYKYMLIANHKDADEHIKNEYLELAEFISVSEDFKSQVLQQIQKQRSRE